MDDGDRHAFQNRIEAHRKAGKTIVYIDESGFAHDMVRTHGCSPRGKRCPGKQDWTAKGRTNVIGALIGSGSGSGLLTQHDHWRFGQPEQRRGQDAPMARDQFSVLGHKTRHGPAELRDAGGDLPGARRGCTSRLSHGISPA